MLHYWDVYIDFVINVIFLTQKIHKVSVTRVRLSPIDL